jgi:AcrR family transcriptional regulator
MARSGGEKTKKKILEIAEMIFSEKGYDGTSIQDISTAAGVNKALIYYHFKNKQDIIDSLFKQTVDEMFGMQGDAMERVEQTLHGSHPEQKIAAIISLLEKKKKILNIMLMESLKNDTSGQNSLFQCADTIISRNVDEMMKKFETVHGEEIGRAELMMHEFFTGFLPIVFFALLKDKWAEFFKCDKKDIVAIFTKIFIKSHIRHN